MRKGAGVFPTRDLLVTVAMGAGAAVFVHLGRIVGLMVLSAAPWLGSPAPFIPWYLLILAVALLIPRVGSATLAGVVASIIGIGTMALMAALAIELVMLIRRWVQGREGRSSLPLTSMSALVWALGASVFAGVVSYAVLFTVPEFRLLPAHLLALSFAVRLLTGLLWGYLAWLLVRALVRAGFR